MTYDAARKGVEAALMEVGLDPKLQILGPEASLVLKLVLIVATKNRTEPLPVGSTDLVAAARIALIVAWRIVCGAQRGIDRLTNPSNTDDPDIPVLL